MLKVIKDRRYHLFLIFGIVFIILIYHLHDLTIVHGEYYLQRSINTRVKKIETKGVRGNIYDRHGNILATSRISYTVEFNGSVVSQSVTNDVAVKLYNLLEAQGENPIQFPIVIIDGEFYFTHDKNLHSWLEMNGYEKNMTAREVFDDVRSFNYIDEAISDHEAYRMLYNQGRYLPIVTSRMLFLEEMHKNNFLTMYGLSSDTEAEEAFQAIRNRREFAIPKDISDEDAFRILSVKHAVRQQGFLKYTPIQIATDVSLETAILIQERSFELPGVYVDYETIREYPHGETAAHILGYVGPIATESEVSLYLHELGYNRNQIIGKAGIERVYERELYGDPGVKYVEVDVMGRYVGDVEDDIFGFNPVQEKMGSDVYLTIDLELQKALEDTLEKGLLAIQEGALYESPWGDYQYSPYPNAQSAAGVVVDVRTGEVLAMASYPAYDVNLFSTGISQAEWNSLNPINPRDPLAARPLYNIATMMGVQPGSVYKMMTGFAAMEQGLNPQTQYYSDGYVQIGNQRFGCWLWHSHRRTHGLTDFYRALEVSCNYYFYNISTGTDYYRGRTLPFQMNAEILTESSKQFGLHERTGLEISEVAFGVPDPDKKKRTIVAMLSNRLHRELPKYFPQEITQNRELMNEIVSEILSWSDENPSRHQIILRLVDLGVEGGYEAAEPLADIVKFDYFNMMRWYDSDTLNLSIGQGDHAYTPVQMARYIATIANGGYNHELTVVKQVGNEPKPLRLAENPIENAHLLTHVQKGMERGATGSQSSVRRLFQEFPVSVAGKTGTAENEGLIPPIDEVAYLTEFLPDIAPGVSLEEVEARTIEILIERSQKLGGLEQLKNNAESEEERLNAEIRFYQLMDQDFLNKGSAMRQAIKELSPKEISDQQINAYRLPYDNYSWFSAYAPTDQPEIAVIIMIPQGGAGGYSAPLARDVIAAYYKLQPEVENEEEE